ncbi:MAG: hypothetical protein NVS9B12_10920 [Vulcanimicrobiaceae bacterium]
MMQSNTIAALAALGGALVALAVYHFSAVAPALRWLSGTAETHDQLLGGGAASGTSRLSSLEEAAKAHEAQAGRVEQRLLELERLARTDVSRVGFVRYNAFADTGSELSYAVALLNREGDGIVLSSIFSREDTRTFGKAVTGYRPLQDASKEELGAIAQARDSKL